MVTLGHVERTIIERGASPSASAHPSSLGRPQITAVSGNQLLASTWAGDCLLIDVDSGVADRQPPVASAYAGFTLRSPASACSTFPVFAVATTAAWAGMWRAGATTAQRIENRFSACNAVALAPDGDLLAIGTGFYPLGSQYPKCAIELWTTGDRPALVDWVRLPDVAVDRLYWDGNSYTLFAWTGSISQDSGHLWRLELDPLRIIDTTPVGYRGSLCGERWEDYIVSVGTGSLELRSLDDLAEVVRWTSIADDVDCACVSTVAGSVLLSNGELVDLDSFERARLDGLVGCTGLAALPTGEFTGITADGVLRIWDPGYAFQEQPVSPGQISLSLELGEDPAVAAAHDKWEQDLARRALDELFVNARHYRSTAAYAALLSFTIRFRWYAPYNALLVQTQMPGATYVAPAHRWLRDYGRRIRPGARPLVILQPMGPVMFVFDVSDTIPEPGAPSLPSEVEHPFEVRGGRIRGELQQTVLNAIRDGVAVTTSKAGSQAAGRISAAHTKRTLQFQRRVQPTPEYVAVPHRYDVVLSEDHSTEAQYATLVHELAHLYCGHLGTPDPRWWPDRRFLTHEAAEFEAESVSYLVCRRLGIDTPAEAYLSAYINRFTELPAISLECVTKVAGLIEQMGRERMQPREEKKK